MSKTRFRRLKSIGRDSFEVEKKKINDRNDLRGKIKPRTREKK